ncbi:hypothetical protein [Brevundimonas sp.]|uniref:hypothetical protein n=1 Tax=Brevundimonas sp. TaxID=1871086 RepID=UPI00391982DE
MSRERHPSIDVRHPMDQPLSSRPTAARLSHADAFDTLAAWRAPEPRHTRFGVANDWVDAPVETAAPDPSTIDWRWGDPVSPNAIAIGGALISALLGALFGTALQL